jgi:hypothetical protein
MKPLWSTPNLQLPNSQWNGSVALGEVDTNRQVAVLSSRCFEQYFWESS